MNQLIGSAVAGKMSASMTEACWKRAGIPTPGSVTAKDSDSPAQPTASATWSS